MRLQSNLAEAVNALTLDYQRYIICTNAYAENKSNVKYFVRLMSEDKLSTYTNIQELKTASDENVTEVFSEYRGYLIYYPDNLVFMGNTILDEDELYQYLREYYYPEITHIWLAVDTSYAVPGDAFYNAETLFNRIVPKSWWILVMLIVLALSWVGVGIYLTATAGVRENESGTREHFLNHFDKIWTEFLILFSVNLLHC